jgi:hypothetical protein
MHATERLQHEAECKIDVIAMDNLYAYSLLLVIFVGLSIVLATSEIGWQLGVRADGRGGNNISALEQSLLGVLAGLEEPPPSHFDSEQFRSAHKTRRPLYGRLSVRQTDCGGEAGHEPA